MLQLVAVAEVREAIAQLAVVEFGGQSYVNAVDLAATVGRLTGTSSHMARPYVLPPSDAGPIKAVWQVPKTSQHDLSPALGAPIEAVPTSPQPIPTTFELEQRRLDALPPGDCAMCQHVAHDGGECVDCGCQNYIDKTNRDPVISLRERGVDGVEPEGAPSINAGGTIPPAISPYGAEAGLPNWKERPPLGHHRPPSG